MNWDDGWTERRKVEAGRRFLEAIDSQSPFQPSVEPDLNKCLDAMELQMMGIKP